MRAILPVRLRQALEVGIQGKLCVTAWHGYPHTLYIGFGEIVLPAPGWEVSQSQPPYEIQTDFSRWRVEEYSEVRGTSADPEEQTDAACELLVGCRVLEWELEAITYDLTLRFEGERGLTITPLTEPGALGHTAWALRTRAGKYLEVCCGGELFSIDEQEPYSRAARQLEPPLDGSLSPN